MLRPPVFPVVRRQKSSSLMLHLSVVGCRLSVAGCWLLVLCGELLLAFSDYDIIIFRAFCARFPFPVRFVDADKWGGNRDTNWNALR